MSTKDPSTPVTPTTPQTPSFPSIPSLLIRTAPQRTNTNTHRRDSSIISIPISPMDTTVPSSPWQRRESISEDTIMASPILDRVPINIFTGMRASSQHPPPCYHITVTQTEPVSQPYRNVVQHMQSPLIPLISVTTGQSHPSFPTSLLQYHLLTHPELDDLSMHYHQTEPPTEHSWRYPCRVPGWLPPPSSMHVTESRRLGVTLDTKRRRFGRFIGLRECETPVEDQKEMEERMGREWQRQLERRRDEERMREKSWRGTW